MDEHTVQEALNCLDPALVEAADRPGGHGVAPSKRVLLLAAVVAAALCLMGAAGILQHFRLWIGAGVIQNDQHFSVDFSTVSAPVRTQNGRVLLTVGRGEVDITDQIDQDTPYLYAGKNAGLRDYLIVGGTPEELGYAEVWVNQEEVCLALQCGEVSAMAQLDAQQFREEMWRGIVELPWFNAGMEQLQEELDELLSAS